MTSITAAKSTLEKQKKPQAHTGMPAAAKTQTCASIESKLEDGGFVLYIVTTLVIEVGCGEKLMSKAFALLLLESKPFSVLSVQRLFCFLRSRVRSVH